MLLGVDLGTTNVKALVTDPGGRPHGEGTCGVQLFRENASSVEQDIEEIWAATLTAIRQAVRSVDPSGIKALGISSQGGAMQLLTDQGAAFGRVMSWLDQRGAPYNDAWTAELGREWFLQHIGHPRAGFAIGQVQRCRAESRACGTTALKVGFVGDVIVGRLCGTPAQDGTSCSLTGLYNPTRRDYDPEVRQRLGLAPGQLPALLSPRKAAGGLLPAVAQTSGLPPGIPVSAAIHDQYAAALANGVVEAGTTMVGTGTAWVLLAVSRQLTLPVTPLAFACHHVVDDLFGQIVSLGDSGSVLARVLELSGLGKQTVPEIDARLESAPAGSRGLDGRALVARLRAEGPGAATQPWWLACRAQYDLATLLRAVVEGLSLELRDCLARLQSAGLTTERLMLSGSAAVSRITPQILADITGLPLVCAGPMGGSTLGAAMLARGLIEPGTSLATIARQMTPAARQVEPGPNRARYAQCFSAASATSPVSRSKIS